VLIERTGYLSAGWHCPHGMLRALIHYAGAYQTGHTAGQLLPEVISMIYPSNRVKIAAGDDAALRENLGYVLHGHPEAKLLFETP